MIAHTCECMIQRFNFAVDHAVPVLPCHPHSLGLSLPFMLRSTTHAAAYPDNQSEQSKYQEDESNCGRDAKHLFMHVVYTQNASMQVRHNCPIIDIKDRKMALRLVTVIKHSKAWLESIQECSNYLAQEGAIRETISQFCGALLESKTPHS